MKTYRHHYYVNIILTAIWMRCLQYDQCYT